MPSTHPGACSPDHLIVGAPDIASGAEHVRRATGLLPEPSGSHPGHGTHNAIVTVSGGHYLEALAPDPDQEPGGLDAVLRGCDPPRLLAWVVRCDDIDAAVAAVQEVTGVTAVVEPGSRTAATGEVFRWRFGTLDPGWPAASALPGLVGWQGEHHPADGAVSSTAWTGMRVETPEHELVGEVCRRLGLDVTVVPGDRHRLVAELEQDGRPLRLA